MRRSLTVTVVSATLATLLGCQQQEKTEAPAPATKATTPAAAAASGGAQGGGGEVVATYGGNRLDTTRVVKEMERLPAPSRAYLQAPDRKRQFIENMILNELLFAEGQKLGYDKDEDIDRQVNDLRRRLVVQRVVREFQKP